MKKLSHFLFLLTTLTSTVLYILVAIATTTVVQASFTFYSLQYKSTAIAMDNDDNHNNWLAEDLISPFVDDPAAKCKLVPIGTFNHVIFDEAVPFLAAALQSRDANGGSLPLGRKKAGAYPPGSTVHYAQKKKQLALVGVGLPEAKRLASLVIVIDKKTVAHPYGICMVQDGKSKPWLSVQQTIALANSVYSQHTGNVRELARRMAEDYIIPGAAFFAFMYSGAGHPKEQPRIINNGVVEPVQDRGIHKGVEPVQDRIINNGVEPVQDRGIHNGVEPVQARVINNGVEPVQFNVEDNLEDPPAPVKTPAGMNHGLCARLLHPTPEAHHAGRDYLARASPMIDRSFQLIGSVLKSNDGIRTQNDCILAQNNESLISLRNIQGQILAGVPPAASPAGIPPVGRPALFADFEAAAAGMPKVGYEPEALVQRRPTLQEPVQHRPVLEPIGPPLVGQRCPRVERLDEPVGHPLAQRRRIEQLDDPVVEPVDPPLVAQRRPRFDDQPGSEEENQRTSTKKEQKEQLKVKNAAIRARLVAEDEAKYPKKKAGGKPPKTPAKGATKSTTVKNAAIGARLVAEDESKYPKKKTGGKPPKTPAKGATKSAAGRNKTPAASLKKRAAPATPRSSKRIRKDVNSLVAGLS